jgi:hypothetical protein
LFEFEKYVGVAVAVHGLVVEETVTVTMQTFNKELPFVNVELIPCKERAIGIEFETIDGNKVVKELNEDGLAFLSMKVGLGFKLVGVDGGDPSESDVVLEGVLTEKLLLRFRRPPAPLPIHGFARKNLHKTPKFSYHDDQKIFLEDYWEKNKDMGIRAGEMHIAMKAKFQHKVRDNGTGSPKTVMWLDEQRIRSWMVGMKMEAKEAKKEIERELKKDKEKVKIEQQKIWEESESEEEEAGGIERDIKSAAKKTKGKGGGDNNNKKKRTEGVEKSQNKKKKAVPRKKPNVSYDNDDDSSSDESS